MGSSTLPDYALFQLTPTRTRFDLVMFYGGKTEKLASGLFEPFISHLKIAQDQISRGGYSIKLSPPTSYAPWFTKSTFERFVRFVSTPAVLERFVILEKEILQIESSAQANESSNTNSARQLEEGNWLAANLITRKANDSTKLKGELERSNDDATQEENSKIQLQRVLGTRKTLLRKEQAMAYASGLVAGFEVDSIDDLISFADAFGASRFREACINFKELCKQKRRDGLWMQELAAMEACPPVELSYLGTSGIVFNNDVTSLNLNSALSFPSNGSDSMASFDSKKDDNQATAEQMPPTTTKVQMPMPWPNQMPQYMYNFQNSYPGFPFPMQPIPPPYAMNMQWPPDQKEKSRNKKGLKDSGEEEQTESSNSEMGDDSDSYVLQDKKHSYLDASHKKKLRKKSTKTVVIRNINYITPKRRNGGSDESSSNEDDSIDEDSLKKKVEDAVGSLEKLNKSNSSTRQKNGSRKSNNISNGSNKANAQDSNDALDGGKTNENWDAFQNLLLKDDVATTNGVGSLHSMDVSDEHFMVRRAEDGTPLAIDLESEKAPKPWKAIGDSFVAIQKDGGSEYRATLGDIKDAENGGPVMKRRDSTDADLVIPPRMEESGSAFRGISYETESSTIKPGRGEDWFVVNHSGKPETENASNEDIIFNRDRGDILKTEKSRQDSAIDDSFMIHARPATNDLYNAPWKTDIAMDADLVLSSQQENGTVKENHEKLGAYEPDDLYAMLERDTWIGSVRNSWNTENIIEPIDISFMETDRRSSVETSNEADMNLPSNCDSTIVKKKLHNDRKVPGKDVKPKITPGSYGKNTTSMLSKTKKPSPGVQKSKQEQEEEIRKKMEEVVIQRQKRIAERTAASGLSPATTKKISSDIKQFKGSIPKAVKRQTL